MNLGATQYTAAFDGRGFLDGAVALGLMGVEPYIGDAQSEFLAWSKTEAASFMAEVRARHLSVPSVAMSVFNGDSALIDADGRDRAVELTTAALGFSAAVGATVMLLCTFIRSHPDTPEKKANLLSVIRAVEPVARRHGVVIALETPLPAEELVTLVQAARSDCVGVYYDLGNAVALGFDPAREIELLGRRIRTVHVKDSADTLGGLHLGRGKLDLAASIQVLKRIQYDGWLILETPGEDQSAVREDIRVLKQCL